MEWIKEVRFLPFGEPYGSGVQFLESIPNRSCGKTTDVEDNVLTSYYLHQAQTRVADHSRRVCSRTSSTVQLTKCCKDL